MKSVADLSSCGRDASIKFRKSVEGYHLFMIYFYRNGGMATLVIAYQLKINIIEKITYFLLSYVFKVCYPQQFSISSNFSFLWINIVSPHLLKKNFEFFFWKIAWQVFLNVTNITNNQHAGSEHQELCFCTSGGDRHGYYSCNGPQFVGERCNNSTP